jgi:hypothetical protein
MEVRMAKIKMTRKSMVEISNVLRFLANETEMVNGKELNIKREASFSYGIARNASFLKEPLAALGKTENLILKDYLEGHNILNTTYQEVMKKLDADKQKDEVLSVVKQFQADSEALKLKFKDKFEERDKFLEVEEEFEFYDLRLSDMGKIAADIMTILLPIVKES